MRRVMFLSVLSLMFVSSVFASENSYNEKHKKNSTVVNNNTTNNFFPQEVQETESTVGISLDAPDLVKLDENWSFGTELGKNLNQTSASEGYFVFAKFTFHGTLFDLGGK